MLLGSFNFSPKKKKNCIGEVAGHPGALTKAYTRCKDRRKYKTGEGGDAENKGKQFVIALSRLVFPSLVKKIKYSLALTALT